MSLVNDMLRDLDKRKQFNGNGGRINGLIGTGLDDARPNALLLPALVVGALLLGLAGGYLLLDPAPAVAPSQPATVVTEPLAAAGLHQLQSLPLTNTLEIADINKAEDSFSLRLRGSSELAYAVTGRNSNSITLEFSGVQAYDNGGLKVEGLSVIQLPDRTLVELKLERDADIELYADDSSEEFDVVLSATYRTPALETHDELALQTGSVPGGYMHAAGETPTATDLAMQERADADYLEPETVAAMTVLSSPNPVAGMPMAAAPARALDPAALPLRVTRGLTLEQQDRNTSQSAVMLVQSGRLLEAYEKLLTFLARNPEAHVSRETLGTVLLAQRELVQAALVVDEGLQLAPNYAPYKKIKARLLLQEGRAAEALQLLQQSAPTLESDQEYHELLATLYQQNGEHDKAVSTYQQLLRTNSAEGRWWTGMGISLEAQGDASQALASYQAALQQSSLDASVRQYSQARVRTLSVQ